MEAFEPLSQTKAMTLAEAFAKQMTEAIRKRNEGQPQDRKPLISLEMLKPALIMRYVAILSERFIIVPDRESA